MCYPAISAQSYNRRSMLKLTTLLLCLLFIAIPPLSTAYIATHLNHTHDHDGSDGGCTTCMHIQSAENLLKQLSTAVVSATAAIVCSGGVLLFPKTFASYFGFATLVCLKVRLNH